jgi:tripartite-type tricarboxylate transporter receptor subunit TctC
MTVSVLRAALLVLLVPFVASAQDPYPSRPISMVVSFPPGGQADLSARPLASAMSQILKQPVVVINRPGAAGAVGNRAVANAAPDGYTVLVTLVSITTIPVVDEMFGRKPAYSMGQFIPLALLVADPPVIVVGAETPWKSLQELVRDARARPDDIVYSHSGLYGPSHLPMEMFLHAAGIKMRGLAAVGGGPTMMLVLSGNAAMWASPPAMAVPHVQGQKLRPLASFGADRHPAFPDVPTLKELGYGVEFYVWSGVFAPAATPEPVVTTLRDAIRRAVASTEFRTAMENLKTPIAYRDAPDFRQFLAKDSAMLHEAVRRIGKVE